MEWSKTKTIFIIAFLILDLYLAVVFFKTRSDSEFTLTQEVPIERKLELSGITIGDLPKDKETGYYISAKSKDFSLTDINSLLIKGQEQNLQPSLGMKAGYTTLSMSLEKPYPIPDVNVKSKVTQFLKENVLYGEMYEYWYLDKEENAIICIQKYKNNKIFQANENHIAMVKLEMNDKNEIYSYEQSMLEDIKEVQEKEVTVSASEAIEALYNKNLLGTGSKLVRTEYGYYTNIPLTNQQILAPTWHIMVETAEGEREDYYVNALEAEILQSPDNEVKEE
ncbi:two-component system regulatory protein YycI [Metabacillus malikii]|uniref:Regulatory protein YycI of two-component signal transduction system YycFG n=1 Tax=Metabacillus malikii TaxID=1504265 RepID=A0ABT9ZFA5_9BACI|nr:two-component system regulatory protein YycI [Metabacillus malikii]MDQ0230924.1 regulatory protein YycI of two-component signal transduction system YycFG [Metabacillus malikii]